ncbi:MAG: amidohydrolase family protein [Planctomycetes bacterium]|nr:amidohydrolase family protein [Planctomycetota bacterium]
MDESEGASELPSMGPPANQELEISIEQCRAWTLENNLDLQVSLMDPQIAATSITEAEARFEALFVASGSLSDADPGQAEVFRDQFVRPFDIAPGIQIPMRTGGTASVAVPLSRRETFPGFPDDDRYATDLDFSISQPLLRHAGRRANTHRIRIAALDSQIVQAGTKLEVIRQIAAVDRAYWLMDATKEILAVRRRQYRRAQEQLQQATARFEGGVGPKIEVIRARAGQARRQEAIIVAELDVKDSQRSLKRIINLPDADVESKVTLVLTSRPDRVFYELDEDELIEAALRERVELLELELKVAQDYSTIDFEENLNRFATNSLFRGIRLGGGHVKDIDNQAFLTNVEKLAAKDLELDLLINQDVLPNVGLLAERIPDLRIVINHVAGVSIDGRRPNAVWVEGMHAAASPPNVYCKVSGLVESAKDEPAPTDTAYYAPTLDILWDVFGEDRLIYGSNWPVSERFADYATVQRIVTAYFTQKGEEVVAKYFWKNARTAYKLKIEN